jgi:hypothetical protein
MSAIGEPTTRRKLPPMLLWGFAPLVLALVLVVLVVVFAPSVAPEHFVPVTTTGGAP